MTTLQNKELPDTNDMLYSIDSDFDHNGKHYHFVVKSSFKPLLVIPQKTFHSYTRLTVENNGEEEEVFHELYEIILTRTQGMEAIGKVQTEIEMYLKFYGEEINNKTK